MAKFRVRVDIAGEVKDFESDEYVTADEKDAATWDLLMEVYRYVGSKVPQYDAGQDEGRDVR